MALAVILSGLLLALMLPAPAAMMTSMITDPAVLAPLFKQNLQQIADAKAKQYQCAFAIALTGPNGLKVRHDPPRRHGDISYFLTTFPFTRGKISVASHVCSSIHIP